MSQEFAAWEEDFTYDKLDRLLSGAIAFCQAPRGVAALAAGLGALCAKSSWNQNPRSQIEIKLAVLMAWAS